MNFYERKGTAYIGIRGNEDYKKGRSVVRTTIVIPNYNGMKYLRECMDSLTKQDKKDFHIIVVDNGSKDESVNFLKEFYPETELILLDKNTGFCHAVNLGIEHAKTEFILLLNNDTKAEPSFVRKMEEGIMADEKIFSVSARMMDMHSPLLLDGAGDYYCALGWAFAGGKGKSAKEGYLKGKKIFSACAGAAIYRKSILNEIGLFDENHFAYLEDCDIGYRAKIFGYYNYYEPMAVVYHAGSGSTGSRYNEFKVRMSARNNLYLIYKNMPLFQILLNMPFLLFGFFIKYIFFVRKSMGKFYREGLREGVKLCLQKEMKINKVVFRFANLPNYVKIQGELWGNIIRRWRQ